MIQISAGATAFRDPVANFSKVALMTEGELGFLAMVCSAFVVFALGLAYGSWIAPGKPFSSEK